YLPVHLLYITLKDPIDRSRQKSYSNTLKQTPNEERDTFVWDPYAEFKKITLANGLDIYAAHWPGRAWQGAAIMIHSGARQDPEGKAGLAHFVEHIVNQNGGMSGEEVQDFFADHGGYVNLGATGFLDTHYGFFAPANTSVLAQSFEIFGR